MTLAPHDIAALLEQVERNEGAARSFQAILDDRKDLADFDRLSLESQIAGYLANAADARSRAAAEQKAGDEAAEKPEGPAEDAGPRGRGTGPRRR